MGAGLYKNDWYSGTMGGLELRISLYCSPTTGARRFDCAEWRKNGLLTQGMDLYRKQCMGNEVHLSGKQWESELRLELRIYCTPTTGPIVMS